MEKTEETKVRDSETEAQTVNDISKNKEELLDDKAANPGDEDSELKLVPKISISVTSNDVPHIEDAAVIVTRNNTSNTESRSGTVTDESIVLECTLCKDTSHTGITSFTCVSMFLLTYWL